MTTDCYGGGLRDFDVANISFVILEQNLVSAGYENKNIDNNK